MNTTQPPQSPMPLPPRKTSLLARIQRLGGQFALCASLLLSINCRKMEADESPLPVGGEPESGQTGRVMQVASARGITGQDPELLRMPVVENPDRSLSPYFFVNSQDPSVERLPLKATSTDVDIAGVIADVVVTQVYKNEGSRPIEARYVFPASTRAAVYAMQMTIGDRVIQAQIQRREEARATYEAARAQGKSASLLEQQRPNVFEMNVANIMPGDEIRVELRYTELLVPTDGIYEFVYPTVVGPRYSNQPAESAPEQDRFVQNPYLKEGEASPFTFDLTATLSAGMPIQGIACPSHAVNVQYEDETTASMTLDRADAGKANKDFILRYRLAGGAVQSGLMLYEGKDENFFLLMAQPPKIVKPEVIPPREFIFIVDISGSMNGYPLEVSKTLLRELIDRLRPQDRFNVELFAGSTALLSETSLPATRDNLDRAIKVIDTQRGGGGTNLLPALERAMNLPRTDGISRSIVVITDGYVQVEAQAFDYIRAHLGDANLFAFGIGNSVNRHLMEGMARVGLGEPLIVTGPSEAQARAAQFRQYIEAPVLTNARLKIEGLDAYDIEPPSIPDVLAQRPVMVFGKYRGKAKGALTLTGMGGQEAYQARFDVGRIRPNQSHGALRYLWARHKIATLADYQQLWASAERVNAVTELGLKYNLLTSYTSFVAVDQRVRNTSGDSTQVDQPLPLPEGVSNSAVGEPAKLVQRQGADRPATAMMAPSAAPGAALRGIAGTSGGGEALLGSVGTMSTRGAAGYGAGGGGMAGTREQRRAPANEAKVAYKAKTEPSAPAPAKLVAMEAAPAADASPIAARGRTNAGPSAGDSRKDADKKPAEEKSSDPKTSGKKGEATTPQLAIGTVTVVKGSMSVAEARKAVQDVSAPLLQAYRQALQGTPGIAGIARVRLTLNADGTVKSIDSLTLGGNLSQSSTLKASLEKALKAMKLAGLSPKAGDVLELNLVLALQ